MRCYGERHTGRRCTRTYQTWLLDMRPAGEQTLLMRMMQRFSVMSDRGRSLYSLQENRRSAGEEGYWRELSEWPWLAAISHSTVVVARAPLVLRIFRKVCPHPPLLPLFLLPSSTNIPILNPTNHLDTVPEPSDTQSSLNIVEETAMCAIARG